MEFPKVARRRTRAGIIALALVATGLAACNPADPPGTIKVDFTPVGATPAPGYTADHGEAFTTSRGSGWVSQTSSTPLSIVGRARERNLTADQRIDTLHPHAEPGQHAGPLGAGPRRGHLRRDGGRGRPGQRGRQHAPHHPREHPGHRRVQADHLEQDRDDHVAGPGVGRPAHGGRRGRYQHQARSTSTSCPSPARLGSAPRWPASTSRAPGRRCPTATRRTAARPTPPPAATAGSARRPPPLCRSPGKGVDRNATPDQRLDTLIQMQVSPARWEYAVPDGTYDVRVAVGDASVTTGATTRSRSRARRR